MFSDEGEYESREESREERERKKREKKEKKETRGRINHSHPRATI